MVTLRARLFNLRAGIAKTNFGFRDIVGENRKCLTRFLPSERVTSVNEFRFCAARIAARDRRPMHLSRYLVLTVACTSSCNDFRIRSQG
jgi:hypothetical protein